MNNFVFYSPTEFVFGKDTDIQTGTLAKKYNARKAMIVYGGWMVERNFSGSSSCFNTPLALLFPFPTRVSRRALLEETKAISYMAKMPFRISKSRMIINSIVDFE